MALSSKLKESPITFDIVVNTSHAQKVPQDRLRRCHHRYAASHLLQVIDQSWHANSECRAPDNDSIDWLIMHHIAKFTDLFSDGCVCHCISFLVNRAAQVMPSEHLDAI